MKNSYNSQKITFLNIFFPLKNYKIIFKKIQDYLLKTNIHKNSKYFFRYVVIIFNKDVKNYH